jgi:hypothetical protein
VSKEAADAARNLVYDAIKRALVGYPSAEEHEGMEPFAGDVADMAAKAADFFDDARRRSEGWPDGWQDRQRKASKAIKQIAKVLESMSPQERECWPEAEALVRADKIKSRKLTAYQKTESTVFALATLWHKHFDKTPAGAENSPFTSVVQAYFECRLQSGKAPSHVQIQAALKRFRKQQNN